VGDFPLRFTLADASLSIVELSIAHFMHPMNWLA